MEKTCPHCQSANAPEAQLCRSCGAPFSNGAAQAGPAAQLTVRWTGGPLLVKPELRRSTSLAQLFARKNKVLIGRAPECDLVLAHPMVSRHHAELERSAEGQLRLSDLGSMNGIMIGGKRLTGSALLHEHEQVGIGPFLFSLVGQTLATIDSSRGLRLQAQALQKTVLLDNGQTRKLLDNINLVIEPGEFVSLLGPSGSGKSTLMDCLNGRRRATGGRVLANGEDFYGHFDNFRQSLGYVPQKDIVHTQLTVTHALYYTACLRLPPDTSARELAARMEEVIQLMELGPHRDTLVAQLSGGQIKRVSLGAELLANPCLLYIDEATSGLDAGTEARMMKLFRGLADEGKSLICITHNVDNVDRCHLIIVLARGKLIYFGPPAEALTYFGVKRISEIYDRLQEREVETWEKEYAASALYGEFVAKRLGADQAEPSKEVPQAAGSAASAAFSSSMVLEKMTPPPRPQVTPWWHQLKVLTLRYIRLLWSDPRSLKLLFLQAPLVALFVLAGFIGKPFQQKIPVPQITDDEFFALELVQALDHEFKAADAPAKEKDDAALAQLKFQVHYGKKDEEAVTIPHRELLRKLRELQARPQTKAALEKIEITVQARDKDGAAHPVKLTAARLLDMQKGLQNSRITEQLLEARAMANTTNPRYTYILLFLMSIIVLWTGCNNAAKEIVKEEAIYGRERAVNLGIFPYLASKFIVLSLITIVQAALLMLIVYGTLQLLHVLQPGFIEHNELPAAEYMLPYGEQLLVLALLSMAGVALGLLLSACVSSPDRANTLLPYVLIPQIILGGGIMPVRRGVLQWLAWFLSPEYWAFRAIRTGETTLPGLMADNRMEYDDTLWLPCMVLLLETLTLLMLTAWFLLRKDVNRG